MRLTHLQVDGLKALRDVSLEIPKLLALKGENGAGKTAIHQAIKIGVLGHDPAIGKRLEATRLLSGGKGDIEVALTFDSGFGIRRSAGKSMETEVAPPQGEDTEKERQERINKETGAFLPSFDLKSLLDLSAEKRRAALFALLPRRLANLDRDDFRHWLGYGEATDVVKRAIDKLWLEKIVASESPTEGLASALAFAREQFLEADRDRLAQEKVTQAAEREATEATGLLMEHSTDNLDVLQADLAVLEQEIGKLRQQVQEAEKAERINKERIYRIRAIEQRITDTEKRVEELTAAQRAVPAADGEEVSRLEQKMADQQARLSSYRSLEVDESHRLQNVEARIAELRRSLSATGEKLAGLVDLPECPVCGSTEDLERVVRKLNDEMADLSGQLAKQEELKEAAEERFHSAAKHRQGAEQAVRATENELREKRAAVSRAQRLAQEVRHAQAMLDGIRQEREAAISHPTRTVEDVSELEQEIEDKERAAFEVREAIRRLQDVARLEGKAEAARERADKHRATLQRLTDRAEALKGLMRALQAYRAHIIQQMVEPVERTANELLQTIDPAKTFRFIFERENRDTFDFGFEEDGVFRSYDAASTGEDAFLAVVFVAALIAAVQPEWRVLLVDNAEAVDDLRRPALMRALAEVSGAFDNVILSGCCSFPEIDGWTVVDVPTLTGRALAGV